MPLTAHEHQPIYRVIRAGWADPLDATHSKGVSNRWNPPGAFAVLYTCCSERVARAIVQDLYQIGEIEIDDLQPSRRPQLVEITWSGMVVDMASAAGILECRFPLDYPDRIGYDLTPPFAVAWNQLGAEGIVCRSASVWRIEHVGWNGHHQAWIESAVLVDNARRSPILLRRRGDTDWLRPTVESE